MLKASEMLRQGKTEELWQMCCGYLKLDIREFMDIQERLLMEQLQLLNKSPLGKKILQGARPRNVAEFREQVPLTTYADYCPELVEKKEDTLPQKPFIWAHSAGRSGQYPCKWVPMTYDYAWELSKALYGIGMLSCCNGWGDTSNIPDDINILYSVAPVPYISGTFADLLRLQSPINYLPTLEESYNLSFEERIRLGFMQAMSQGFDYFFGLSLVLLNVGEKIRDSSKSMGLKPFLKNPKSLWRVTRGKLRSKLAKRAMMPRDLWKIRGIIGSGTDSWIYKDRIEELWGRKPLDLYACTEGGVIATQAWDYQGMTFSPHLNFLEFIPENEQLKWQMDQSYRPKTLLLNEVSAGEKYEVVITSFHGGVLVRYKIGDMINIQSLRNENLGINTPQMTFERRVDDFLDFYVVNFTERSIWQAIENAGIAYEDWVAYKDAENLTLNIVLELKEGYTADKNKLAVMIYGELTKPDINKSTEVTRDNDLTDVSDFKVKVNLLPKGTFARYTAQRQAEGADLAHLKPPHVNPPPKVLSLLTSDIEETIIVTKLSTKVEEKSGSETISII